MASQAIRVAAQLEADVGVAKCSRGFAEDAAQLDQTRPLDASTELDSDLLQLAEHQPVLPKEQALQC